MELVKNCKIYFNSLPVKGNAVLFIDELLQLKLVRIC